MRNTYISFQQGSSNIFKGLLDIFLRQNIYKRKPQTRHSLINVRDSEPYDNLPHLLEKVAGIKENHILSILNFTEAAKQFNFFQPPLASILLPQIVIL